MKNKCRKKKYTNRELLTYLPKQGDEIISSLRQMLLDKNRKKTLRIYTSNSRIIYDEENEIYNKAIEVVAKLNKLMADKTKKFKNIQKDNKEFSKGYKFYKILNKNSFGKEKDEISHVFSNLLPLYYKKNYNIYKKDFKGDVYSSNGLLIDNRKQLIDYFTKNKKYFPNNNKGEKYLNFIQKIYNQLQNVIFKHRYQIQVPVLKVNIIKKGEEINKPKNIPKEKNKNSKDKREDLFEFLDNLRNYKIELEKRKEENNHIKELINIAENEYKNYQNESITFNNIDHYNDNSCSKSTITKHVIFREEEQKKENLKLNYSRNSKQKINDSYVSFTKITPLLNEETKNSESISKKFVKTNSFFNISNKSKQNNDELIFTKTHYLKSVSNDIEVLPKIKHRSSFRESFISSNNNYKKSNLIKIKKISANNLSMDQNISTNQTMKLTFNDDDSAENINQSSYINKRRKLRRIYEDLKKCNYYIKNSNVDPYFNDKCDGNKKMKTHDLLVEIYGEKKVNDFNKHELRKDLKNSFINIKNSIDMLEITNNIYKRFKHIIPRESNEMISKSKSQNDILKGKHIDFVTCLLNNKIRDYMI